MVARNQAFLTCLVVPVLLVAGSLLSPSVADADTHNWIGGSGTWGTGSNWSPIGPPHNGDSAMLSLSDGIARTIDFETPDSASLVTLHLDLTGSITRATTLAMTGGNLNATIERVGDLGRGVVNQSGGSHTVTTQLTLGYDTGSRGTYSLTNDAYLGAYQATIGYLGSGTVTIQDDAVFYASNWLAINNQSSVVVDGGTLGFKSVDAPSRISFLSGTIHLMGTHVLGSASSPAFSALFAQGGAAKVASGKNLTVDYATVQIQKMDVDAGSFNTYQLQVNNFATDALRIINGGNVVSTYGYIGYGILNDPFIPGAVLVRGPGSTWKTETLVVGRDAQIGSPEQNSLSTLDIEDGGFVDVSGTMYLEGNGVINLNGGSLRLNAIDRFTASTANPTTGRFNFNAGELRFIGDRLVGADETMNKMIGAAPTITPGKGVTVEGIATLLSAVTLEGGTFSAGQIVNANRLNLRSGALEISDQAVSVGAGGTFESLDVATNLTVDVALGSTNYGLVSGDGTIGGAFYNATGGELRAQAGRSLALTGVGNSNAGQIKLLGGELQFTDLTNEAGGVISGNGSLIVPGGLLNLGTMNFAGTANIVGPLNNALGGKVTSAGGGATIFYDDIVNDGEIRTSTNAFTVFFGSVSGAGTLTGAGTVNFEGNLSPGNSPAAVSFAGNVGFGPAANIEIEIGGITAGSQYDQLLISGALSLDGSLSLSLINGFTPSPGQTFNIFDWVTRAGTFASLNLPTLAGLAWNTSHLYTLGELSLVAAGIPGDYNGSGSVDSADYVLWRKNDNTEVTLPNDSTPGTSSADYSVWRAHFGQTAGNGSGANAGAAVPEPTTAIMIIMAVLALCPRRRKFVS